MHRPHAASNKTPLTVLKIIGNNILMPGILYPAQGSPTLNLIMMDEDYFKVIEI